MNPFTKPRIALYMAGIFLAGGLSGGVVGFQVARQRFFRLPPPQNMSEHIMDKFNAILNLTPDQNVQIKPLVEEGCNNVHVIQQKAMTDGGVVLDSMDTKIKALLNPEQRLKFDGMTQERKSFGKDHKGPPGSRPPGSPPHEDGKRPEDKQEPHHN